MVQTDARCSVAIRSASRRTASTDSLSWSKTQVDVITLDDLFATGDPDLIKIDVEGAEYSVLLGARDILRRGRSRFLVEVHSWGDERLNKTPSDVFNLFAEFGYDFTRIHRHWHFFKSERSWTRQFKHRAVVFILSHESVKAPLKRLMLTFSRIKHLMGPPVV